MELIFYTVFAAIAFGIAVFVIFSFFGLTSSIQSIGQTRSLQWLMILITIGSTFLPAAIRISTGAEVDDSRLISQIESDVGTIVWAKRLITASILLLAVGAVLALRKNFLSTATGARPLRITYLLFFTAAFVVAPIFSTVPAVVFALYYPLPVLLALLLSEQADTAKLIRISRICVATVLLASMVLALYPKWGFAMLHYGLIPGLPGRLAGATSHPNSMAPLGLLYIFLAAISPLRNRWLHCLLMVLSGTVIVLAQSKTVLGSAVLAMAIVLIYQFFHGEDRYRTRRSNWIAAGLGALIVGGVALGFLGLLAAQGALPFRLLNHRSVSDLATFVGRTDIWNITLSVWERNQWFGYGPTIWSPEFRAQYLMLYVGQAHNQFMQTLGEAGICGLFGLLIYIGALIVAAKRTAEISRGLSLAVLAFFLTRCVTEAPLRSMGVSDPSFLTHFIVVSMLLHWLKLQRSTIKLAGAGL